MKLKFGDLSGFMKLILVMIAIAIPVFLLVNKFPVTINYDPPDKIIQAYGADEEDTHFFYEVDGVRYRIRKGETTVNVPGPTRIQLKDGELVARDGFTVVVKPINSEEKLIAIHNNIGPWTEENLQEAFAGLFTRAWSYQSSRYLDVNDVVKGNKYTQLEGQASERDASIYNEPEEVLYDIGIDLISVYFNGPITATEGNL